MFKVYINKYATCSVGTYKTLEAAIADADRKYNFYIIRQNKVIVYEKG